MTEETETEDKNIKVEQIPASGDCGEVSNFPVLTERLQKRTGCSRSASYQVYQKTDPPEDTDIISACEDHVEDAKRFLNEIN
jgi:hypothetical protein